MIVVPAGVPRKPGMTRDDLFNINATIVKTIAEASAKVGQQEERHFVWFGTGVGLVGLVG